MQKYNNVCDVMHMKLFHLNDIYCLYKNPTQRVGLEQSGPHDHLIES
jgi:hypothetical protein